MLTEAHFEASAGQKIPFVLTHSASHRPPPKRVEALFERVPGLRNDVRMLSEEYDSMVGLVNAARLLDGSRPGTCASSEQQHLPGKS